MAIYKRGQADNGVYHFPKKMVTLYGTAAITAGDWVQIETDTGVTDYDKNDVGASVTQADAVANGNMAVIGVATETTTAAGYLVVQIAGRYDNANVADAVNAGDGLIVDATSGGQAVATTATDVGNACGLCLVAPSSNQADVMIINQGWFD